MHFQEQIRIVEQVSMMKELIEYNEIFLSAMKELCESGNLYIKGSRFPYYCISNKIAPDSKPLLLKYAWIQMHGGKLPEGLRSVWHPDSFCMEDVLHLYPGHKFCQKEIVCTLSLDPTKRLLLRTHDILEIAILEKHQKWYACLELETKSLAMIRQGLTLYPGVVEEKEECNQCEE